MTIRILHSGISCYSLGAPHDDDPNEKCPQPFGGFIMSGGDEKRRYFFAKCSDQRISAFVK
jgi:hypothetical protein